MNDSRYSSSTTHKTPPPPQRSLYHKRAHSASHLMAYTSSVASTCTPSRNVRSTSCSNVNSTGSKKPRMTPSPTILRYPPHSASSSRRLVSSVTPIKLYSGRGGAPASGGDRFVPSRRGMNMELGRSALRSSSSRSLIKPDRRSRHIATPDNNSNDASNTSIGGDEKATQSPAETPIQKEYKRRMMSSICNVPLEMLDEDALPRGILNFGGAAADTTMTMSTAASVAQSYSSVADENNGAHGSSSPWRSTRTRLEDPYQHDTLRVLQHFEATDDTFSSAVRHSDTMIHRKIPSQPCRILDAPDMVDDFYLNLISWSPDNVLAVALAHCVYLWNASTGEIQHLSTIEGDDDYVTSVAWCTAPGQSKYLAIGTNSHEVQLWDTQAARLVRTLRGHAGRVASMAWNQHWLSSGGRDSLILQHDVRAANHLVSRYKAHEQEVCGLKWNDDGTSLASGGNENYLCIWDAAMSSTSSSRNSNRRNSFASDVSPRLILKKHKAAVKALDWCPFNRGLLATGGGTADRTIKLWNSNSGAMLRSIDTGSQVCSVVWSKHQRELCSSHGFSENQLILWKYGNQSSLTKVKELTGHTARILSLACSPDGSTVVSAAGDESLRFWNIFGSAPSRRSSIMPMGELTFGMPIIR